ncbi:MAG TPA: HEAT repeat domain-containing protein [Terriglobales bacterium]|nr:HEAT repeat domain-containing protein [Terriglobales bacterium]
MNCQWVKENTFLYAYDELSDDLRFEFEQHVNRCADCANEVKALNGLRAAMDAAPVLEPSASLLASARMRLQEQLEIAEQERGWKRWFYDPFAMLGQMKFSPALAAVILMVGFVGGGAVTWKMAHRPGVGGGGVNAPVQEQPTAMSIAGIREIQQDPTTNKVSIKYDTLQPQTVEGNINDQRIQQLLLYAARNNNNSGIRLNSISALTQQPEDSKIREALIASLRFDSNPGVRLKTLEALGPYVKDDQVIRNAMVEALLHDTNPGVRSLALQMLQPVKGDSTVRMTLQFLSEKDKDQAIRRQSRAMLATLPQIY